MRILLGKALVLMLVTSLSACNNDPGTGGGGDVPTNSGDLLPYLQSKAYINFPKESAIHPSKGPHGSNVRTYINPTLEASLTAGNAQHPIYSAAVKERYSGSDVIGWSVYVKTQADSAGGQGFYWYEIANGSTIADGKGEVICTSCHVDGNDFVQSQFPLQ